jgi:ribosomal protein S27AE
MFRFLKGLLGLVFRPREPAQYKEEYLVADDGTKWRRQRRCPTCGEKLLRAQKARVLSMRFVGDAVLTMAVSPATSETEAPSD